MYDDFVAKHFVFSRPVGFEVIVERLAEKGRFVRFGARGMRLIPHDRRYPTTYFNPDGSMDVITKDLDLTDVLDFVGEIGARLGVAVEGEELPGPAPGGIAHPGGASEAAPGGGAHPGGARGEGVSSE